ncbi:MAG: hypothetical protein JWO18_340 [Microbacteriaceae bacterium]|nr:hypothetical protein [Microbacteriaceae bacterium]
MSAESKYGSARTALGTVNRTVSRLTSDLIDADARVHAGNEDAIHKMRKTVRRLRDVLATFRGVLDRNVTDDIRERLSALGHALAPARDNQVQRGRSRRLLDDDARSRLPRSVHTRLIDEPREEYDRLITELLGYLEGQEYFRLLDDLDSLVARPPVIGGANRPAKKELRKALRHQTKRAARRLAAANHEDPVSLHDARKAARRVRYVAEALTGQPHPVLGKHTRALADAAEHLQDVAGEYRDTVLFISTLESVAQDAATAGEDAAPYRRFAEAQTRHAETALHRLDTASARLDAEIKRR